MTFGEKFRAERIRKKMTQQQVADALNLNLRMITRYEKNESFPRTREGYRRIAELFDCSINYLLTEDDEFDPAEKGSYSEDSRMDAQKLISSFSGLFAGGTLTERPSRRYTGIPAADITRRPSRPKTTAIRQTAETSSYISVR